MKVAKKNRRERVGLFKDDFMDHFLDTFSGLKSSLLFAHFSWKLLAFNCSFVTKDSIVEQD